MRLISGLAAAALAVTMAVAPSAVEAQAAPRACATSSSQWLGSYSGKSKITEDGTYQPFELEVLNTADGEVWAEFDYGDVGGYETYDVIFSSGVLRIQTGFFIGGDAGYSIRTYQPTSVSCTASGEVAGFGGDLTTYWSPGTWLEGAFEATRTS